MCRGIAHWRCSRHTRSAGRSPRGRDGSSRREWPIRHGCGRRCGPRRGRRECPRRTRGAGRTLPRGRPPAAGQCAALGGRRGRERCRGTPSQGHRRRRARRRESPPWRRAASRRRVPASVRRGHRRERAVRGSGRPAARPGSCRSPRGSNGGFARGQRPAGARTATTPGRVRCRFAFRVRQRGRGGPTPAPPAPGGTGWRPMDPPSSNLPLQTAGESAGGIRRPPAVPSRALHRR